MSGADAARGLGLVGLTDRVEALGGSSPSRARPKTDPHHRRAAARVVRLTDGLPVGIGVRDRAACHALRARTVGRHHEDPLALGQCVDVGDPPAVRRPGGPRVGAGVLRQPPGCHAVRPGHPDVGPMPGSGARTRAFRRPETTPASSRARSRCRAGVESVSRRWLPPSASISQIASVRPFVRTKASVFPSGTRPGLLHRP